MNEFIFCFLLFTAKKTKFVCLFFRRIYGAPICLRFYLTFSKKSNQEVSLKVTLIQKLAWIILTPCKKLAIASEPFYSLTEIPMYLVTLNFFERFLNFLSSMSFKTSGRENSSFHKLLSDMKNPDKVLNQRCLYYLRLKNCVYYPKFCSFGNNFLSEKRSIIIIKFRFKYAVLHRAKKRWTKFY